MKRSMIANKKSIPRQISTEFSRLSAEYTRLDTTDERKEEILARILEIRAERGSGSWMSS
jgi:hypothetical protein